MARVAVSSAAATCFGRVWRINRLAPRTFAAPLVCCSIRAPRRSGAPWPSLELRRMVSSGAVAKKEKMRRMVEWSCDEEEDEDDEEVKGGKEEADEDDDEELKGGKEEEEEEEDDDDEEEEEEEGEEKAGEEASPSLARKKVDEDDDPGELEIIRRISANGEEGESAAKKEKPGPWKSRFPPLSQKEKKELRAHAHRLGKTIASQHIGKLGVTANTIKYFGDTLERNEIMKVKVLDNCPMDFSQVMQELEEGLEAQVVGKVGHVLVLYRPSLRKAEMDEKKRKLEDSRKRSSSSRPRQGRGRAA